MFNTSNLTSRKNKILYIVLNSIYLILFVLTPIFIMRFIDSVIDKNIDNMILYASLYFGTFLLVQIFGYLFYMIGAKVESNNFTNFYLRLNNVLRKYDPRKTELTIDELNQQIGQNYEIASDYFFLKPVELAFAIVNTVVIFTIMFFINWKISLILLFLVPASFLISKFFEKRMYYNAEENLKNMKTIKEYTTDQYILSKEERFLNKKQLSPMDILLSNYRTVHHRNNKTRATYLFFFTYMFLNLAILIVILLSGYLTYEGSLTIGVLFAFQNYTSQLWSPGETLISYTADYQQAKPALEELKKLLNTETLNYENEKVEEIKLVNFEVLNNEGNSICDPINYSFEVGNSYLIIGDNGSGKTSLIEAIMGYNNRFIGEFYINNKNILSNDMVYISANSYISSFYNENFKKGSSGQQKFTQTNLFIKTDKTVYIFDEPTNFIDEQKSIEIFEIIEELKKKNKLIIIISHDKKFSHHDFKVLKIVKK